MVIGLYFISDLEPIELVQGEHSEWELPEIYAGIYPLDKVIIEPSEDFSDSINFDEDSLALEFNGEA